MSDYGLDDAYDEARELGDQVESAQDKARGFYLSVDEDDTDEELINFLSKNVESELEKAYNAYKELKENLSAVEQIREQVSTPENLIEEAEDRYLEEELAEGSMAEVVEYFDINLESVDRSPENAEEAVRVIARNLRNYEALHEKIERSSYDFDTPDLEFEDDEGKIFEETAEETIDRAKPEDGQFFTEE